MTAFIAITPSMRGFGAEAARQIGPQARNVGARAGRQAGVAFTTAASKESAGWFAQTAKGALKNVTLYGSMYKIIQGVSSGIDAMFESMIGFNAEIEQATIGFETLLGSASAAEDQMRWIKDFAKETPFQYKDLVGYSQQLLALGFDAEQTQDVLQATGDAAAALGRGSESIARINLALGQMWTKGKVQSQEMLQLTEAGIGAWQILAEAYGASVEDVQEAVTKGQIKASEAVPALISGMNAKFGGLMEQQSQTYAGIVSNIQDTLQQELAEAGEPLFRELKEQAEGFLEALDDPEVLDMMSDLGEMLANGVTVLADAGRLAWQFRDAILAVGIAYAASKLLMRVPLGSPLNAATWFSATRAQAAYQAGLSRTTALQAGLTDRGAAMLRGAGQVAGLVGVVDGYRRVSEAATEGEVSAIGFAEAIGGGAVAGAAFGSVIPGVGTAVGAVSGAVVGLATSVWSYQSAVNAANHDTSLMQQALQNLSVDANLASLALSGVTNEQLEAAGGFDSMLAAMKSGTYTEYLEGLQKQADSLRDQAGAQAEAAAATADRAALIFGEIESAKLLGKSTKELDEEYASLLATQMELEAASDGLIGSSNELDALLESLGVNSEALAAAQEQVVANAYQAAYAGDMQTGSLGKLTEAAWNAVVAEGGLGAEALTAAARMEGLAGTAGYATQMIAGIPVGTKINFTTNAAEIMAQIAGLIALREAAENPNVQAAIGHRINELTEQANKALTAPVSVMSLPSSAPKPKKGRAPATKKPKKPKKPKSDAKKKVDDAKKAMEEAARKLKKDRGAQRQFGDAFGSIMDAALEGDFDQYRDRLADQIKWLTENGYKKAAKALKANSKALTTAARDYAALTNKLEAAQAAYDDLTRSMQNQYAASRDQILGLGQLTDAQSFDQLTYLLGETTSRATEYQNVLKKLKGQGLSDELWDQLAQAGPESMALAQSILAQGKAGIKELNSLSGGLVSAADSMGTMVSKSMYAQGANAMKAYIKGLKSQSKALEGQLGIIANNVLTKTAGAITPGNAGYSKISAAPQTQVNEYNVTVSADSLGDLKSVQDFLKMLEQMPTTQLVNQAGTVTS